MFNCFYQGGSGFAENLRSRAAVGMISGVIALLALAGSAAAQSQMTPGAPSVPLRPQALANGVASRITYQYNTEFVTIGAPGNANWMATPGAADNMTGNGGVNYEYRIGRTEITTSQWVAFLNAALSRPTSDRIPYITVPGTWGAQVDPTYRGPGQRFRVIPGRENFGVGDLSWRAAAIYCNWLHNDQQTDRQSFLNGAYDVSTFGVSIGNHFRDQDTHNPGAKFWIPTLGEWMKAAYYDPNKGGPGVGGYWRYPNGTNVQPIYGSPSDGGEANSSFSRSISGLDATLVPVMSYSNTQSAWGLMDLAGGVQEWTEGITQSSTGYRERLVCGSTWTVPVELIFSDRLGFASSGYPSDEVYTQGFRIAASVPTPSVGAVMFMALGGLAIRRRR